MAVTQNFLSEYASIVCSPPVTMSELALACQGTFNWFLGHGAYRMSVERRWSLTNLHLEWKTDLHFKRLDFTPFASFRELQNEGYMPKEFRADELWKPQRGATEFKLTFGHQRVSAVPDEGTFIEGGRQNPIQQILGIEANAMADMIATVFVLGAKKWSYQVSGNLVQIKLDKSFTEQTVRGWLDPFNRQPTYHPQHPVTRIKD
jgi:hypothetical protein